MSPPNPGPSDCSTGISTPLALPNLSFTRRSRWCSRRTLARAGTWSSRAAGPRVRKRVRHHDDGDFIDLTRASHGRRDGLARDGVSPDFATNRRVFLTYSDRWARSWCRAISSWFVSNDNGVTLWHRTGEFDPPHALEPAGGQSQRRQHRLRPGRLPVRGPRRWRRRGRPARHAAHRLTTLLGKMLRIDVDTARGATTRYRRGNPFSGERCCNDGPARPELPRNLRVGLPQSLALELRQQRRTVGR